MPPLVLVVYGMRLRRQKGVWYRAFGHEEYDRVILLSHVVTLRVLRSDVKGLWIF